MSSEDHDQQDKHLPASEQKLKKAREEGQVPRSRDLASLLLLGGAFVLFATTGGELFTQLASLVSQGLTIDPSAARDIEKMSAQAARLSSNALLLSVPLLFLLVVASVLGCVAVGGWNYSLQAIQPQGSRIDPITGFGRILSKQGLAESCKLTGFVLALACVLALVVWVNREGTADLAAMPIRAALSTAGSMVLTSASWLIAIVCVIAAVDVPLQSWRYSSRLRMSAEDQKQEMKESDGDPHLKAKIRGQQRRVAMSRMMDNVATADVVITNPTHYAVALSYPENAFGAPRVVAKGADLIAQRIRETAAENRVPLLEAPPLARALYRHTEIEQEIPAALYQAVAQVLAYVFQLRRARLELGVEPEAPTEIDVPPGMDPNEATK
ncbi:MAG: flagellar biosynthesis protein FlhB [Rhodocyclaceae bacterium]|jgi:flagellar biosynthetic protein FlhB|nr:flagellar biosynthesis protein FlhB [Rhodocyclaceae bacterium]MCE2723787.1 flagellar type III secretion system protein FlhB [Betaproteobacteria bacterium]MCA3026703.1 flagellar biosynthesis protein FlhB [Rhodocyclaceae bacterium]MCA3030122.1 flagellar biosynthesis protein FlhB [Rhodocyclaceae bacterium]MCA3031137.1 flagellar biosynthesis protein FlhB [Rhodocyclaceae bacterium]